MKTTSRDISVTREFPAFA